MRPLICEIRLHNLRHNYQTLKQLHDNKLLAVVKANAYGHGAVECAKALQDIADGFAVACLEEAIELREQGINNPIVLLEGVFQAAEYQLVEQYHLWTVIHQQSQLEEFLAHPWQQATTVWLKMDSGMHRAGFFPHNYAAAYTALKQSPYVKHIVKMTHFSCADDEERNITERQIETFDIASQHLAGESSLANSAGMIAYPEARREWGRAGIALYGASPFTHQPPNFETLGLKPVMRLKSEIFAERVLQPHEPIGYGNTFFTKRSTRVGLVACGYADGYPRHAATGTPVAINQHLSQLLGRISMDMLAVDMTQPQLHIGNEVELFGDIIHINDVAHAANTIPYEILCNIKRAHRQYSHE